MALRVAMVALAMWGVSTTLGTDSSSGCTFGSPLQHIESRRGDAPLAQRRGQRRVVNDAPRAMLISGMAVGFINANSAAPIEWCDCAEYGSTSTRWSALRSSSSFVDVTGFAGRLQLGCQPRSVVVDHRHPEPSAPRRAMP